MGFDKGLEKLILQFALANAVQYGGKANAGAVIGKIIAIQPELKKNMGYIGKAVAQVVGEVNKMGLDKQKKELKKIGEPEKVEKKEREGLPELEGAVKGKVVMRLAPNPNAPFHIGHTRMVVVNDYYANKIYKGKLILRFDDTDPKNPKKVPLKEAYGWMKEDLEWLGVKWVKETRASERLSRYYQVFEEILKKGFGYVCTCPQDKWSEGVRVERIECPCRENSSELNLDRWGKMLGGELKEGEAVGRIKTSLEIKDPAVIDWVAFRAVNQPMHPFVRDKLVWPMLDFASAVDDFDFKVTHIMRGKDLMVSEGRQRILYDYFGWKYPVTRVYGKLVADEEKYILSKSKIVEGIMRGVFKGWDDPRLATLRALRRRGIQPEAIKRYMLSLGLSEHETNFDVDILYSFNRELIDKKANRHFFVAEPVQILLSKIPTRTVSAPLYPGKRKMRKIPVGKKVFVDRIDFIANRGKEVRLMHFANYILDKEAKYTGKPVKDIPKIHWVPEKSLKAKIVMDTGKEFEGLAEPALAKVKVGQIVQMERLGFFRCDSAHPLVFYFAHK